MFCSAQPESGIIVHSATPYWPYRSIVAGRPCSSALEDDVRHASVKVNDMQMLTMSRCQVVTMHFVHRCLFDRLLSSLFFGSSICCRPNVAFAPDLSGLRYTVGDSAEICSTAPQPLVSAFEQWVLYHGFPRGMVSSNLSIVYVEPQ